MEIVDPNEQWDSDDAQLPVPYSSRCRSYAAIAKKSS